MIVTEEEAKTKRCQESFAAANNLSSNGQAFMVPVSPHPPYSGSQYATMPVTCAPTMCIGSACMAWRWARFPIEGEPDDYSTFNGYCGKAGKP